MYIYIYYISLVYLKRHFCNVKFFYIDFDYYFFKQRSSSSEVFLKILQNLPENICAGASVWRTAILLKQRLRHRYFLCFCKIFKNIYFLEHLRAASSEIGSINSNNMVRSLSEIWGFFVQKSWFFGNVFW